MANRRSLKSDVSFLEKISVGAVGTQRVSEDLKSQGHNPIELERGSMSFKIWKEIKIKRIRVPDILCISCSTRIESRAKTSFEISMSHSTSDPERGWDFGLADNDVVALVVCRRIGDRPIDWHSQDPVQYVSVHDLRSAETDSRAIFMRPKGPEEGFEARITWPAAIASSEGKVVSVTNDVVQYRRQTDNRMITLRLLKQGRVLEPLVKVGDAVAQNQVVAAVLPVWKRFPCPHSVTYKHYLSWLSSPALSDRYGASKALASFARPDVYESLRARVDDRAEHIYVRLEAAAGLARHGGEEGWSFVRQCLDDPYLQNRLEAVIVLAEIPGPRSCELLSLVLMDDRQHAEIRAGAAWGLGELQDKVALGNLIDAFSGVEQAIRVEAARALAKLAPTVTPEILSRFRKLPPDKRPGIAWALSKSGSFSIGDMLESLIDDDARHWVAYVLGTREPRRYVDGIERLKEQDPEVYFAVTVLWKILTSWVYGLEEYG